MGAVESFLERFLPLGLLIVSLVSVPLMMLRSDGAPRLSTLKQELGVVQNENADLKREIAQLRSEVRGLRDNPTAIERIARDQLGMIRKSEVVFQFSRGGKP